ncbi:hypothetical protein GCM10010284_38820 [Streptomyces rubiginosohelvolus]|uniref:Uncharacterized protein n=1 Tax=Streptomyces rubiginosohelvolus TaxID=67362 RepID=A0ABQ3C758_9ACTN|nr:hypothetical protein GCM10010284_38820 [Streptomyces rubiginosohelvolus]GGZ71155.1 hypothetical protein GCM10010328_52680 [Streptomyces pluricolorescens]
MAGVAAWIGPRPRWGASPVDVPGNTRTTGFGRRSETWPTGTGCALRRHPSRAVAGPLEKQDARRCSLARRRVYDTTGIAIPDRLVHAPSSVTHAFAGVWAMEE